MAGPAGRPGLLSVGADGWIRCWDPVAGRENWHDRIPHSLPRTIPSMSCATVASTGPETASALVGDVGGRIWHLSIRHGIPERLTCLASDALTTAGCLGRMRGRWIAVAVTREKEVCAWDPYLSWWG